MKVLVSGATGFVGRALIDALLSQRAEIVVLVRKKTDIFPPVIAQVVISDLSDIDLMMFWNNNSDVFHDIDIVIHLAARVHVMSDMSADPRQAFKKNNCDTTLSMARFAVKINASKLIFLSSVKVNGETTEEGHPFLHNDSYIPTDYYGLSKYEAEQGLKSVLDGTSVDFVIIRPPLVYGPGVKANFAALVKLVSCFPVLPFGGIRTNKRSLVSVGNLIDLIIVCLFHENANNKTFLVSDGCDLSTKELVDLLADVCGKNVFLLPVPVPFFYFVAGLLGKRQVVDRLCGSLQVDIQYTCKTLGWTPPLSVREGLFKLLDKTASGSN
jgi:nucleoside-diphosphate-sugar epimerase